jgi:glyceraldehyde 3-phosphate dehydrogenase
MATRVGINGFGRIGRQSLKAILERHPRELEVVAINDLADPATNAQLFRYDSTYGRFNGDVQLDGNDLVVNGHTIKVFQDKDPGVIPWGSVGAEIVIESTGFFTDATKAAAHRRDSVKKVIISAPAKNEDITLVLGVNQDAYDPAKHHVVSNASCTTNGLAPLVKVINDAFGIENGLMTTIHSYTNSQALLDVVKKDIREARSAPQNIVPASTGAAKAVVLVIPELKGRLHGISMRVPTPTVSIVDFTCLLKTDLGEDGAAKVNAALKAAAEGPMKGILGYTEEELVSMDFKGDERSSIVDSKLTTVLGGKFVKACSWYDNEWGYSCRIADITAFIAERL